MSHVMPASTAAIWGVPEAGAAAAGEAAAGVGRPAPGSLPRATFTLPKVVFLT